MAERSFKVIALAVGGKNNKIYRSGDTVYPKNFPDGNVDRLVHEGFLKEIIQEEKPAEVVLTGNEDETPSGNQIIIPPTPSNVDQEPDNGKVEESEKVDPVEALKRPGINDISTKELKKKLHKMNVPFEVNASKEDLYDLLNYVS